MKRALTIIRESKQFPFETEQDALRWVVIHGLKILDRRAKDKEVSSTVATLESWLRAATTEMEMVYYGHKLSRLERTIEVLIKEGHAVKAEQLAENIYNQSDRLEDEYWAKIYRDKAAMLKRRVARLIAREKKKKEEEQAEEEED